MEEIEYRRMREVEDRHWWYVALHELVLRFVKAELRARGPLKIFDAGCGTGGLLARLASFGEVSGCDFSPHALRLCAERGLSNVSLQDLNELALPADSFDVITCMDVIEHGWIKSDAAVIGKLFAALKPGGLLVLNCTAFDFLGGSHDAAVHTARRYAPRQLRMMAERAGFSIEKLTCRMFLLFVPIFLYRRMPGSRAASSGGSDVWMPPFLLNVLLLAVARLENFTQRFVRLPVGTSLFLVARKRG